MKQEEKEKQQIKIVDRVTDKALKRRKRTKDLAQTKKPTS